MRVPLSFTAFALLACLGAAHAQQPANEPTASDSGIEAEFSASGRSLDVFPSGIIFPVYIADPHRPGNAAMVHFYTRTEIFDTTSPRFGLKAGGRFGVLRLVPASPGGRSWQLSIEAGLSALFDSHHTNDSVGWDGVYGAVLTTASGSPFAFKIGFLHRSAHVGDEYAERTGRTRIGYTREELAFGVSWHVTRSCRFYAEGGYGYYRLAEIQEPWRVESGLEYESASRLLGDRFAWYAALDVSAMEERSWQADVAVQAGLTTPPGGQRWRIGVGYYHGRPPFGEFYQHTEARFTIGLWMDL